MLARRMAPSSQIATPHTSRSHPPDTRLGQTYPMYIIFAHPASRPDRVQRFGSGNPTTIADRPTIQPHGVVDPCMTDQSNHLPPFRIASHCSCFERAQRCAMLWGGVVQNREPLNLCTQKTYPSGPGRQSREPHLEPRTIVADTRTRPPIQHDATEPPRFALRMHAGPI